MKKIDKIAWIETKNGKILSTRSKGKEKFYIPGGKREDNESDEETLIREIKEELSVVIIKDTIEYLGAFKAQSDGAEEGVLVKMTCYKAKFEGTLLADNEIEEIQWLDSSHTSIISEVDKKIFSFLKEKREIK